MKILAPLKWAIAFLSAGYGCLYILGVGLVGSGNTDFSEIVLKVFLVSIIAGLVLALLPRTPIKPLLSLAAFPTGLLTILLLLGYIESFEMKNLLWISIPAGIFLLIVSPSVIRILVGKKTD